MTTRSGLDSATALVPCERGGIRVIATFDVADAMRNYPRGGCKSVSLCFLPADRFTPGFTLLEAPERIADALLALAQRTDRKV